MSKGSDIYKKISVLGEGAYGKVYRAQDKDGNHVAIKRILLDDVSRKRHKGIVSLKEANILAFSTHPYVNNTIKLVEYDPFSDCKLTPCKKQRDDKLYIISPIARYSLYDLIWKAVTPISHMKRAMYQIMSGLYYLHHYGFIHRDIKPGNVLCYYKSGVLTAQLADFGMSRPVFKDDHNSLHIITSCYRPPEILLGNRQYDEKVDIWAMACTFYEMVVGRDLFSVGNSQMEHLSNIFKIVGAPSPELLKKLSGKDVNMEIIPCKGVDLSTLIERAEFDDEIVDHIRNPGKLTDFCNLLKEMLQLDPDKRPSAWECLQHPFFSQVNPLDEKQYGIIKQEKLPAVDHFLKTIEWAPEVISLFRGLFAKYGDDVKAVRTIFLGMDLYQRVIEKYNGNPSLTAVCCGYLAFKYYEDQNSPFYDSLFPTVKFTGKQVEDLEIKILKDLQFVIYRPTLFNLVNLPHEKIFSIITGTLDKNLFQLVSELS